MDFSDLVALKIKELMQEQNITIYKLENLSGVYSSTIAMFLSFIIFFTLFFISSNINFSHLFLFF